MESDLKVNSEDAPNYKIGNSTYELELKERQQNLESIFSLLKKPCPILAQECIFDIKQQVRLLHKSIFNIEC